MAKVAWVLWPLLVWFSVLATANHFWLDIVAGIALAGVGTVAVAVAPRALKPLTSAARPRPSVDDGAASTLTLTSDAADTVIDMGPRGDAVGNCVGIALELAGDAAGKEVFEIGREGRAEAAVAHGEREGFAKLWFGERHD